MRKMRSFLGVLASLFIVFLSANAFADYDCDNLKHYTSCSSGYYLSSTSTYNSCDACTSARNTESSHPSLANGTKTKTCTGNYTGGGGGSSVGSSSCSGCSKWSYTCSCNAGYTEKNPDSDSCSCEASTGSCGSGQYYNGSSCVTCPAGSYCDGCTYTVGGGSQCATSCPGSYTSDSGATSSSDCYMDCTTSDVSHSSSVSGRKYYNGSNTCKATTCDYGYELSYGSCYYDPGDQFCSAGTYLNSSGSCVACPDGYYCPGGTYPLESGEHGKNKCPSGTTGSSSNRSGLGNCYKTCPDKTTSNGTVRHAQTSVSPTNSSSYPDCTYYVDCNDGYKAVGDGGTNPSCQQCAAGKYCSNNTEHSCESGYTSFAGSSAASDCYRNCATTDIPNSKSVTGSVTQPGTDKSQCSVTECNTGYFMATGKKSCTKCPEHSVGCDGTDVGSESWTCEDGYTKQGDQCVRTPVKCQSGKYYNGTSHVDCSQKGKDYYCPGTTSVAEGEPGCAEQCPVNFRDGVDSPYNAATNCYHSCPKTHTANAASVTASQAKIYYPGSSMTPACQYTVNCNKGYKPQAQGTENAACVACDVSEYCPGGTENPQPCPAGYTCTGGDKQECEQNHYCSSGVSNQCPNNGKTDGTGKSKITDCYQECPTKQTSEIPHSTKVTKKQDKVFHTGSGYPVCTYDVECDVSGPVKYKPSGNGTATPSCVWNSEGGCPEGYYCPPGGEPLVCPDGGHTKPGATKITDCFKTIDPYPQWGHGTGSATCHYSETSQKYDSRCDDGKAHTCEAGYYYGTKGSLTCQTVENGYYSPANDTERKECPAGGNGSTENADSYDDCYKICTLVVPHSSSVTPKNERVNANSTNSYPECSFTVVCNTGYTVSSNESANPTCEANKFTVTLNKNGGDGSVAGSVECTFDQSCTLPYPTPLTRTGYTNDKKWCSTNEGGEPCYDGGSVSASTLSPTGTAMTLHAKWTPNVYAVNLDDQNSDDPEAQKSNPNKVWLKFATGWFSNQEATLSIANLTQSPTRNGYTFSGFNTETSSGTQVIDNTGKFITGTSALSAISTDNATIYGQWAAGNTNCEAGQYYDNTPVCKQCPADHYCPGGEFGTGSGVQGNYECPSDGKAPAGSSSYDACYKTVDYNPSHGSGTQTCDYNSETQQYDKNCRDQKIDKCHAGYYLTSNEQIDCSAVGNDYYSPADDTTRHQCPNGGKTRGETSGSIQDCYKNVHYEATYGSGTQDCYYTRGDDDNAEYATNCENKHIDNCRGGYYRQSDQDIDCTIVEQNYYSEKDEIERHECPKNGTTEGPGTDSKTLCRLDHLPYNKDNGKCEHCSGYQRCYYNPRDDEYTDQCNTPTIEECDAGYWFDEPGNNKDCSEVGLGYWSPDKDLKRYQCTFPGTTDSTTSSSATQCYNVNTECEVENGSGKHKCNWGTDAYNVSCTPCVITGCDMGYSISGTKCEECPEGFYCGGGEAGEGGGKEQCPAEFPHTLPKATSKNDCFKYCTMGENAAEMSGGVFFDNHSTCKITKCASGYTLQNGACVPCPAGSYCDGTVTPGEGGDGSDVKSCDALGNAYDDPLTKWEHADQGADAASDCYAECKEYTVEYGKALPDSSIVHYPQQCTYHGESETGNPCDLVGVGTSAQCVENACKGNYEMIDGKCTLCQRDHALSYRTEGNCLIESCEAGYHSVDIRCEEDVIECKAPNATTAKQTWDAKAHKFSKCTITECDEGYHLESNACVPNGQACDVDNGHGYMEWDTIRNTWGKCVATHCDPGYTNDPALSYEPNKQCGQCKNKFSQLGEQAVSSYTTECEIATCMYQGELYNLENNECMPICTPVSDETGTRKRVGTKCERKCNDGYMSW